MVSNDLTSQFGSRKAKILQTLSNVQIGVLTTVSHKAKEEETIRKSEAEDLLIPEEIICSYLDSRLVKKLFRRLAAINDLTVVTKKFYLKMRNHLILFLTLTNGKRSGVFSTMQVDQALNAKLVNDGFYRVGTRKAHPATAEHEHVTSLESGPRHTKLVLHMDLQNVILHPLLYAAFKKFITVTKQALKGMCF